MFAMDTATLEVPENTAADMAIGVAFDEATDPDGDMLTYSLGGDDAESFDFDASTRQIKTMAPLDYETNNMYMVTVMATDPDGGYDSIMVTINVTPVTATDPDAGDTLAYSTLTKHRCSRRMRPPG
jgi:hypothetical protein